MQQVETLRLYPTHHKAASKASTWRDLQKTQVLRSYHESVTKFLWRAILLKLQNLQKLQKFDILS